MILKKNELNLANCLDLLALNMRIEHIYKLRFSINNEHLNKVVIFIQKSHTYFVPCIGYCFG